MATQYCSEGNGRRERRPTKTTNSKLNASGRGTAYASKFGSLLTTHECAAKLGSSRSTVDRLAASGELAFVRIGADRRFPESMIDDYIESRLVSAVTGHRK